MERLLTEKEVSRLVGYKLSTLRKWRCTGGGPQFRKFGTGRRGQVRYEEKDVRDWMQSHPKVRSTSEYPAPATAGGVAPDDGGNNDEGISYRTAKVVAEQVLVTLGIDYLAGFRARQKARKLNPEQSGRWQEGWKACDRSIREYAKDQNRIRIRERV